MPEQQVPRVESREEAGEEFFEVLEEERFEPEADFYVRRGRWDRRPKIGR